MRLAAIALTAALTLTAASATDPTATPTATLEAVRAENPTEPPEVFLQRLHGYVAAVWFIRTLDYAAAVQYRVTLDYAAAIEAAKRTDPIWDRIAACESGGRWDLNTGTYDGGLQFHPQTWTAYRGDRFAPYAWQATKAQQIEVAKQVLDAQGWGAWPACSRKAGLR